MRTELLLLVALLAAVPAQAQRIMNYGKAPAAAERQLDTDAIGIDQRLGEQVPLDLVFRDEHDSEITLGSCVAGKPTVLVLAYYRCPQMCNEVLNSLLQALKGLPGDVGDQFNVVVVSFDPKDIATVAAMKKSFYLEAYGRPNAEKGWRFLTGNQQPIHELCDAVGFRYQYDKERKQFNHASGIMVITPIGKLSKYLYGLDYDGLKSALEDAGAGKIGKEVEPNLVLKLLCYERDPDTGKYTVSVMKALRIVFGTLVLVLAVWLFRAWRRPPNVAQPVEAQAQGEAQAQE